MHVSTLSAPPSTPRAPPFDASSSRFFPGRHRDRNSSFHLEISRAPEAGAMPAYILKVLAPAAQSFIRHSHATLPSAACSPIFSLFTQDPKIWWREPKNCVICSLQPKIFAKIEWKVKSSQVKFLLSTQIQNSPPLVPGAGSLRRRQNLNHPGAR